MNIDKIAQKLKSAGYKVEWQYVPSRDYNYIRVNGIVFYGNGTGLAAGCLLPLDEYADYVRILEQQQLARLFKKSDLYNQISKTSRCLYFDHALSIVDGYDGDAWALLSDLRHMYNEDYDFCEEEEIALIKKAQLEFIIPSWRPNFKA